MNATFKMKGRGAKGTAFIMGIPAGPRGERLEYVLITTAHVLELMRGDQATLFLRGRIPEQYAKLPLVTLKMLSVVLETFTLKKPCFWVYPSNIGMSRSAI